MDRSKIRAAGPWRTGNGGHTYMERGEHIFRTAVVGGFNRQDVLDWLENRL